MINYIKKLGKCTLSVIYNRDRSKAMEDQIKEDLSFWSVCAKKVPTGDFVRRRAMGIVPRMQIKLTLV